jgi:hypothetical protein
VASAGSSGRFECVGQFGTEERGKGVKDHTARALDKPAAIGKKEKNDFIDRFACASIVQLPHPCSEKD